MERKTTAEALKTLLAPQAGSVPSPLSGEKLADYLEGNLPLGQQEEMREHLMTDQDGRDLLLELSKFPDTPWPEEVATLTDAELQAAWLTVNARTFGAKDRQRHSVRERPSRVRFAWAAGVTLVFSVMGARLLYLENRVGDLARPQTNPIIEDLFSSADPLRQIDEDDAAIMVHRKNTPLIFLLHLPSDFRNTSVQVTLVSASGQRIWHAEELSTNSEETVAISFPPGFLQEGVYEFRTKGASPLQPSKPASFPFRLVLKE